jgi:transposase
MAAMRRLETGASIAEVFLVCEVNPNVLHRWRRSSVTGWNRAFPGLGKKKADESQVAELERKIGQQTLEIDFLKRALQRVEEARMLQALCQQSSEVGLPLGRKTLARSCPGQSPHGHDSLYPTFGGAEQPRSGLGRGQRRDRQEMPRLSVRSIIGHGRRRKQAHDEDHDWIPIRSGLCNLGGKTFTLLPPFSPPYCHYSLTARSQTLRRYFLEGCSWEEEAPVVKDSDRIADPSTLRRWFCKPDSLTARAFRHPA